MANFEAEKLARKYCEQYGLEEGTKDYATAINAFCVGYKHPQDAPEADVGLNNLLSCHDLAKAMNDNKKQIVILDDNHNVRELAVARYGLNDNVILVHVKRVE